MLRRRGLAALAALAGDAVLVDRRGTDSYGRTLAHVYTAGEGHINVQLVAAGFALENAYGTPDEHTPALEAAEAAARDTATGLWAADACGPPASASLGIAGLVANPAGDELDAGAGEYIELSGPPGAELAGWTVKDETASHRYTFPAGAVIGAAGGRPRVHKLRHRQPSGRHLLLV